MREALNELPSTPDEAFENILRRIEEQERHSATTAIRTLTWCYYSRRPLKMDELCQALVVEDCHHSLKSNGKSPTSVVDSCLSFVIHDQSTGEVRFIHPSVQRWFNREPQNQKLLAPDYLAKTCLTCLNFNVFDVPTGVTMWFREDFIAQYIGPYPFYGYAAQFWSDHTRENEQEPAVQRASFEFLESENRRALMLKTAAFLENRPYTSGQTVLHVTASYGLAALCYRILNGDVRYTLPLWSELTCSDQVQNDSDSVRAKAGPVDKQDERGRTPLYMAAEKGHDRVVEMLLEAKADVDLKEDGRGETALHMAASKGHDRVVGILLEAKADVDKGNKYGETALQMAANRGHDRVVEKLLEVKADVDKEDEDGWTALHLAVNRGHDRMVGMLLEAKANVDRKDRDGRTALYHAIVQDNHKVVKILSEVRDKQKQEIESNRNPAG